MNEARPKKGHILYNSVCVKCPEWANPQAAEQWLPGDGGKSKWK